MATSQDLKSRNYTSDVPTLHSTVYKRSYSLSCTVIVDGSKIHTKNYLIARVNK